MPHSNLTPQKPAQPPKQPVKVKDLVAKYGREQAYAMLAGKPVYINGRAVYIQR